MFRINHNSVTINGRLVNDIEVLTSKNNVQHTKFTLACDRCYDKDGNIITDWIDCKAFGRLARFLNKYLKPGDGIIVEGSLQTSIFEDKNGIRRKGVEVVIEKAEFADGTRRRIPVTEMIPEDIEVDE